MLKNIAVPVLGSGINRFIQAPSFSDILVVELKLLISLPSIRELPTYDEDPLLSETQKEAIFWKHVGISDNKKVAVYWNDTRLLEFPVFRRSPYYYENLISRYTDNLTFEIEAGSSLGIKVEETNTGLLGAGDSLLVWGACRYLDSKPLTF